MEDYQYFSGGTVTPSVPAVPGIGYAAQRVGTLLDQARQMVASSVGKASGALLTPTEESKAQALADRLAQQGSPMGLSETDMYARGLMTPRQWATPSSAPVVAPTPAEDVGGPRPASSASPWSVPQRGAPPMQMTKEMMGGLPYQEGFTPEGEMTGDLGEAIKKQKPDEPMSKEMWGAALQMIGLGAEQAAAGATSVSPLESIGGMVTAAGGLSMIATKGGKIGGTWGKIAPYMSVVGTLMYLRGRRESAKAKYDWRRRYVNDVRKAITGLGKI